MNTDSTSAEITNETSNAGGIHHYKRKIGVHNFKSKPGQDDS